ncbi:hypothetical protein J5491_01870 [Candidatus Saccharibacteria bacterium]|nr:hypothetical protein [Candidatus Saccharibacteria bacterium]
MSEKEDRKFLKSLKRLDKQELALLWSNYTIAAEANESGNSQDIERAIAIRTQLEKMGEQGFFLDYVANKAAKGIIGPSTALYEYAIYQLRKDGKTAKDILQSIEENSIGEYIFKKVMTKVPANVVDIITAEDIEKVIIDLYTATINYMKYG